MKIDIDKNELAKIAQKFKLKFVILHGSNVTGALHKESDFDIAVLGQQEIDFQTLLELHESFSNIFQLPPGIDLDIKSLRGADPLFRSEVVDKGNLLFGDPAEYEEFKAISRRMFEDAGALFALERRLAYKFQKHLNTFHAKPEIRT